MEPSVGEGFSFLDLEDCGVEERQYLETMIEQRDRTVTRGVTESNVPKPSDKSEFGEKSNSKFQSRNVPARKRPETAGSVTYATVSKSCEDGHVQAERIAEDRSVTTNTSRMVASEKEAIVATDYEASINVAMSSRGSIRGGQQHPSTAQAPQQVKVRPIQQTAALPGISNYLTDTAQVSPNPITGHTVAAGQGGNVPQSYHPQTAHPIQNQHQKAYEAAYAHAVQQQQAPNQQTPYVFINQVTANVNVHHGPVSNGQQHHPGGTKDTGNNSGAGANQQLQMQHSPGMAVIPTPSAVPGPPSLQNTQPTGIHPIHMQTGQMGSASGLVPQSMNQPPPLQTNVASSLAASGITHPTGTGLLPSIIPNTFQIPHQMAAGPIASRSGSVQPQQQVSAHPNPATMLSMQQLQHMYGYPIFFNPNVQVNPYAHSSVLHGIPHPQLAQVHPAQVAQMAQFHQAQMVQQNANQRQGIPPLQSHPTILRNPLSPPAMQQGANPMAIPISQAHQTISGGGAYTNQRSVIQPISTTAQLGASHNATSQHTVPRRMMPSNNASPHLQTQLNPQAPFFPSQPAAKASLPASVVATSVNTPNSVYAEPSHQYNTPQEKLSEITQKIKSSSVTSVPSGDINIGNVINNIDVHDGQNNVVNEYEQDILEKPSSNDEFSQQGEEEGLAFGTVDLKSLVPHGDVNAFECDNTGIQYFEKADNSSEQINAQEGPDKQDAHVEICNEKDSTSKEKLTDEMNSEPVEEKTFDENDKQKSIESGSEVPNPTSNVTPDIPAKKSWASLFKSDPGAVPASEVKPIARIEPYKDIEKEIEDTISVKTQINEGDMAFNGKDVEMGNYLKDYSLNHRAPSIKPRGLSNRSNWCFVNAILQALVACPPFYNLMKSLPKDLLVMPPERVNPSVKILRAVYYFFAEFSPLDNFPKLNRSNKNKKNEDLPLGKILEPTTIYNFLLELDSDTFKVIEGRQEDAEEFLTFLLNGLNDEMIALLKLMEQQEREKSNESEELQGNDSCEREEDDGNDEEWREVGPRGTKSCVTRRVEKRRNGNCAKSPLAEMFQGQMRSQVQHSNGEPTATLQPFLTLQLDIQSEKICNVADAIACNFAEEAIDGYMCSKTNQEIEASRSMSLEELPPILVLHLKRFIYDGSSNGCQKLLKNIDFPVDLEINKDILSSNSRNKYPAKQRQYKLFAVVYHNGSEATKGHYVTDMYHTGLSTWLGCDDSILKTKTESMVLAHSATSVPYILFYRRGDTMVGGSQNDRSGSKSTPTSNNTKA